MSDAAPCSTEPVAQPAVEAQSKVDRIQAFIDNFRFLSSEARAHLEKEFEELRGLLADM